MSRIIKFMMWLLVTFVAFALPPIVTSCDSHIERQTYLSVDDDEPTIEERVQAYLCPTFSDVQSVLDFRSRLQKESYYDSVFMSIPIRVLEDVANVLISRQDNVCMTAIVSEYLTYRSIYDNLSPSNAKLDDTQPNTAIQEDDSAVEGQRATSSGVISRVSHYRTDTMNGKPVRVRVTTEESYE